MTPLTNPRSGSSVTFLKRKSVLETLPPPLPPQPFFGENDSAKGGGDAEVWRSFREAGLLDEVALQKKDRESLVQRISDLEKELREYQYNMGLLLIEEKDWDSKYQELRRAFAEVDETLKKEKSAHLASISEYEKREVNLQKALGVERQCVSALEKALCELRSELAEVKFMSDKKLDNAHSLEVGLEEKYLEVEQKLHSADAKLSEASRRVTEVDRKLVDVESREKKLQKEYLSFTSERKLHEKDITDQRERLHDWGKKLQDSQKRLADSHSYLNERDGQANYVDKTLNKKVAELEEAQKLIETTKKSLELKEEDIAMRLSSLAAKEKEAVVKFDNLDKKEKDLLATKEKLNARERVEIQKLVDNHNALLSSKEEEFELYLERDRKSFDEKLESKICDLETKKKEIEHVESQLTDREQALQIKFQQSIDREKELHIKSTALNKWEESVHNDEQKLEKDRQQLSNDCAELLKSKSEFVGLMAAMESSKENMKMKEENLRLTKNERGKQLLLQSNLKQEIEDYRIMKESLLRETEDLQQQKKKFEEEWEALDEKILTLEADIKKFNEERESFEKWQFNEEERMKSDMLVARANFEMKLEELWQKKEAFQKTMEHDRLEALEVLKRERADVEREFELQKHELEMDMLNRKEEMEKKLLDRENEYQGKKDMELNQMKYLSSLIDLRGQNFKLEEYGLNREKEVLASYRKQLEVDQLEIANDINSLHMLSKNLKEQREEFIKEKEHFIAQVEQKTCKNCQVRISDLEIFAKQNAQAVPLPDLDFEENLYDKHAEASPEDLVSPSAGSADRLSWLQKCSRIFNFSPGEKAVGSSELPVDNFTLGRRLDHEAFDAETCCKPAASCGVSDSFDSHRVQSVTGIEENGEFKMLDESAEEPKFFLGGAGNSIDIMRIPMGSSLKELGGKKTVAQNKREKSVPADTQTGPLAHEGPQPSRRGRPKAARTHTTKAAAKNAKTYLGRGSTEKHHGSLDGEASYSLNIQADSHGDLVPTNMMAKNIGKRQRLARTSGAAASELDAEDSEACSESISHGGRRKRRQIIASASTITATAAAAQTISDQTKGFKTCSHQRSTGNQIPKESGGEEGSSRPAVELVSDTVVDSKKSSNTPQKSTLASIIEIQEIELGEIHVRTESSGRHLKLLDLSSQNGDGFIADDAGAGTEPRSEPSAPSGDSCSEEDDDDYDPPNASIGKKIWTFFTT